MGAVYQMYCVGDTFFFSIYFSKSMCFQGNVSHKFLIHLHLTHENVVLWALFDIQEALRSFLLYSPSSLFSYRDGKLHLAKDTYNHAPKYLSGTQTPIFENSLNLRKCCHSSEPSLPSTSATKLPKGQGNNVLAMAGEAFWFFLLREFLEILLLRKRMCVPSNGF